MTRSTVEFLTPDNMPIASVLVVDNCRNDWVVVRSILEQFDLELTYAPSGEDALELARVVQFDVILMDHRLPGMQGDEVARRIRAAQNANATASIIAFTSEPDLVDTKAGYNAMLGKPIDALDLTTVILIALAEQEALDVRSQPSRGAGRLL